MKENKNNIITYSAIEQRKNGIVGIGRCLLRFLGIFPFVPLVFALFSHLIQKIPYDIFEKMLIFVTILCIVILLGNILNVLKDMMTVFIINELGDLYHLKISVFWYKIKDKMYLLNPSGMAGGKLIRLFYMINNIKIVLQSVFDDISYDDLIAMGKMERLSKIENVKIGKKHISFNAYLESKKKRENIKIRIKRLFERDAEFCEYLKIYESKGKKEASKVKFDDKVNYSDLVKIDDTPLRHLKKLRKFTINWICIMAWVAAFTIIGDISMCKPVIVVFSSVEFVYIVMKICDYLIDKNKIKHKQ